MSAFRLHKETILPVLYFRIKNIKRQSADVLERYNCIIEANRLSLCARYGDDSGFEPADVLTIEEIESLYYDFDHYHPKAEQIIKFCHCIDYQNCELDSYGNHRAAKIIRGIKVKAYLWLDKSAHSFIKGYDDLLWEA